MCKGSIVWLVVVAAAWASASTSGAASVADCIDQMPPRLRPWCTLLFYQQPLYLDDSYPSRFHTNSIGSREGLVSGPGFDGGPSVGAAPSPVKRQDADHVLLRFGRRR